MLLSEEWKPAGKSKKQSKTQRCEWKTNHDATLTPSAFLMTIIDQRIYQW